MNTEQTSKNIFMYRKDIGYIQNMTVINKIASYKAKRMKGNTQNLFDGEVLEK